MCISAWAVFKCQLRQSCLCDWIHVSFRGSQNFQTPVQSRPGETDRKKLLLISYCWTWHCLLNSNCYPGACCVDVSLPVYRPPPPYMTDPAVIPESCLEVILLYWVWQRKKSPASEGPGCLNLTQRGSTQGKQLPAPADGERQSARCVRTFQNRGLLGHLVQGEYVCLSSMRTWGWLQNPHYQGYYGDSYTSHLIPRLCRLPCDSFLSRRLCDLIQEHFLHCILT